MEKTQSIDFEVVVSSENSPYLAWQTQLFCFSALTRLGKHPTVVVHRTAKPLQPEFRTVESWGCPLLEAPSYSLHPKGEYPPRNELGSLLTIAWQPGFRERHVLFCEPDMLFVKPLQYPDALCGEYYRYIDYRQARLETVAQKLGIADRLATLNDTSMIGVPYLIPGCELMRIAVRWIEVLDLFEELEWIDIMYAFGLAIAIEGMSAKTTHLMVDNLDQLKRLERSIIHYCYGDWRWDKKAFRDARNPLHRPMPSMKGVSGTILGEIFRQIRQARTCERFPRAFKAIRRLSTK